MKPIKKITFLVLLFLLGGCSFQSTDSLQSSTENAPHPTIQKSTPSPTGIIPTTQLATKTELTATPTPTIQLQTQTPLPTYSPDEAKDLVFNLLKDNGNCKLPCLWGLQPNEMDIISLQRYVAQFGNQKTSNVYVDTGDYREVGGMTLGYRENHIDIFLDLSYLKDIKNNRIDMLTFYSHALQIDEPNPNWVGGDASLIYGDPFYNQTLEYYLLPQILSNYGPPTQILLATWPDEPDRLDIKHQPFSLVLYYQDKGFIVEYVSDRERKGSNYIGCPLKSEVHVSVWDPEIPQSLKSIVSKKGGVINNLNLNYFLPIDEATSMTSEEFYQTFKDADNQSCVETPQEFWQY